MTTHHKDFPPSAADRWLACAGSVAAVRGLPNPSSPFAVEGSVAHFVLADCLEHDRPASDFRGLLVHLPTGESATVDDEMVDAVQSTIDRVRLLPGVRRVEQKVDLSRWIPNGYGTADVVVMNDGIADLVDFKYGKGVRVSADTAQLRLYALGAWYDFAHLFDVDLWRLTIDQPRLDHVETVEIRTRDLLAWGDAVVRPAVAAALSDAPTFNPTDKGCRWCLAAPRCRALADHSLAVARAAFADPAPTLSNAEIGDILARAPIVETWIGKLRDLAFDELSAGRDVPGWKVVEGRSVRTWSDETVAARRLIAAGADPELIYSRKLISPAQAEKVIGKEHGARDCVVKPEGKPTLAPVSDPRSPIVRAAADVFSPVKEV